ncbi:MAG: hypothetical protein QOD12_189 [Verrucomicrobiota bacterium]
MTTVTIPEVVATPVPVSMPITAMARYHAIAVGIESLIAQTRGLPSPEPAGIARRDSRAESCRPINRRPRPGINPRVESAGAIHSKPGPGVRVIPVAKCRAGRETRGVIRIARCAGGKISRSAREMRGGRRIMRARRERASASPRTGLRRLQQSDARSHHHTKSADDFHV